MTVKDRTNDPSEHAAPRQRADRAPRRARPLTKAQTADVLRMEAAPYAPEANLPGECPQCGSTNRMVRLDPPGEGPNPGCSNGWHKKARPEPVDEQEQPEEAATAPEGTDGPPAPPEAVTAPQRPVGTLAVRDGQADWTPDQLAVIDTLIQQTERPPRPILSLFLNNCQRTGLDPFARQIYLVGRYDSKARQVKWTTQTGIDGFRVVAQRSGEYAGQTPAQWCGPDGEWRDVWLLGEAPAAARIGIHRRGFVEPLYAVATWKSYYPGEQMGFMWKKMPDVMLAKVAEALALRKAFPHDLSGLYTAEEMAQQDAANLPASESVVQSTTVQAEPEVAADPAEVEVAMRHAMSLVVLGERSALSDYWRELKGTPVHRAPIEFNGGTGTLADLIVWCGTHLDVAQGPASDWIDEHPAPEVQEVDGQTVDTGTGEVLDGIVVEDVPADAPEWTGSTAADLSQDK